MAVEIRATYNGQQACSATHGPSASTTKTVAPVDNGGDGSTFSPTDLIATGLATCVLTILAQAAEFRGVSVVGARARVEKHMSTDKPRRIVRLPVHVEIPHPAPAEDRVRVAIENAADHCPVHATLGDRVDAPITFEWGAPAEG